MEPFNNTPQFQKEEDPKAYLTALNVFEIVVAIVAVVFAVLYYLYVWFPAQKEVAPVSPTIEIIDAINAFNQNNFDKALEKTNFVLTQNSKNISALLMKATTLSQRGSVEFKEKEYGTQAIVIAKQALEIAATDTEKSEAWRIIGYANEIMERYTDAFSAYDISIKLNPKNALAISQKGHAHDLNGDRMKAKLGYEQALKIDNSLAHAHLNLGRLLFYEKNYVSAEKEFNVVIGISNNKQFLSEAEYDLGLIKLYKYQNYQLAFSHFNNSVSLDDSFAIGWVGVATAKYYLLVNLLANNPTNDNGKKLLSGLVDALRDIEKATKINPNQTTAYLMTGKILNLLGEKNQAKGALDYGLTIIDKDISLGVIEKNDMRKILNNELVKI